MLKLIKRHYFYNLIFGEEWKVREKARANVYVLCMCARVRARKHHCFLRYLNYLLLLLFGNNKFIIILFLEEIIIYYNFSFNILTITPSLIFSN